MYRSSSDLVVRTEIATALSGAFYPDSEEQEAHTLLLLATDIFRYGQESAKDGDNTHHFHYLPSWTLARTTLVCAADYRTMHLSSITLNSTVSHDQLSIIDTSQSIGESITLTGTALLKQSLPARTAEPAVTWAVQEFFNKINF